MPLYCYVVVVLTDTIEHADEVMANRLGADSHRLCDDDYGFEYQLSYDNSPEED